MVRHDMAYRGNAHDTAIGGVGPTPHHGHPVTKEHHGQGLEHRAARRVPGLRLYRGLDRHLHDHHSHHLTCAEEDLLSTPPPQSLSSHDDLVNENYRQLCQKVATSIRTYIAKLLPYHVTEKVTEEEALTSDREPMSFPPVLMALLGHPSCALCGWLNV